jgi:hypothetical protein
VAIVNELALGSFVLMMFGPEDETFRSALTSMVPYCGRQLLLA